MDKHITTLTDSNNRDTHNIDDEIKKIVKEINIQNTPNAVIQHLECIKNLLQKPQYRESYSNIRPLFESQEGFYALKEVLLFECNQVLGKTTQENINILSAVKTLRDIFTDSNDEASEIQKNITNIDQSIKLQKRDSEDSKAEFQKRLKEESKTNLIIKLLRFLFKRVINKIFEEMKKEQLVESGKKLNGLKDQFHKITDSFNKELNSLMDAYGKGIESSSIIEVSSHDIINNVSRFNQRESEYYIASYSDSTMGEIFSKQRQRDVQQELLQPYNKLSYVSTEEMYQLKKQQKAIAKELKVEYQMVNHYPKYIQICDLPKPQRAQISEIKQKLQVPLKPSREVIERASSKSDAVTSINQQNSSKELSISTISKVHSGQKLGSNIQGSIDKIWNKTLVSSTKSSSKHSPSSSKKPSTIQNSKVQGERQSIFYSITNSDITTSPLISIQRDLEKVKLTKKPGLTSKTGPKEYTVIWCKATKEKNIDWNQALSKSPLFNSMQKKVSSEEEKITRQEDNIDLTKALRNYSLLEKVKLERVSNKEKEPKTKLKNPKIEHEKSHLLLYDR